MFRKKLNPRVLCYFLTSRYYKHWTIVRKRLWILYEARKLVCDYSKFTWEVRWTKPVWDFISVKNLTSVFSQLFACVHTNWGEMKLKTVWISYRPFWPKWNFKPAWDFHVNIIYPIVIRNRFLFLMTMFTQNEMNNRSLKRFVA